MRKVLIAALLCLTALVMRASEIGSWQAYTAYGDVTSIATGGQRVYVLASGSLYSYSTSDAEVRVYNKVNALNDTQIAQIAWSAAARRLVIVYDDGNIDLLGDDDTVVNIADFYNKSMTEDKTVNGLSVSGRYAYVATAFGVLKVDVAAAVIADTYNLGRVCYDVAVSGSDIFVSTPGSIVTARLADNLVDKSVWRELYPATYQHLVFFGSMLYGVRSDMIARFDPSTGRVSNLYRQQCSSIQKAADRVVISGKGKAYVFAADESLTELPADFPVMAYDAQSASYWVADGGAGSPSVANVRFADGASEPEYVARGIKPDGPKSGYFGFMRFTGGKLYTVPGLSRDGAVQVWDGEEWQIYDDSFVSTLGHRYRSNVAVAPDPTDPARVLVASWTGLYEFRDGRLTAHWNLDNSPLRPAYTVTDPATQLNYVVVHSLAFDAQGTAWLMNAISASTSLFSLSKDGTFTSHHNAAFTSDGHSMDRLGAFFFDSRGLLWMTNNYFGAPCLLCYNPSTDEVTSYSSFVNEDGTLVNAIEVTCVTEDADHNIWVGTNLGPIMLTAQSIATGDKTFQQIKVPRNDGTNLADYLLSGVSISAIAVDGGNRKWFASSRDGVYLIDSDNMTELQHFTMENSPLTDDVVESVAIDGTTGLVYFGTQGGLCSYRSDASEPSDEMTSDNVYAYPNPVAPDYSGPITIVGLTVNADVKIVTANGALVAEGRSNGGTFVWDGCDKRGRRVASGVYMVETATQDGGKGTVCKVAVVK